MPTPRKHESAAACQAAYRKRQAETRRLEQQRKGLPTLPAIPAMPGTARWDKILAEAAVLLYMVVSERESYYDDRSEEWQESERGEEFVERTDALKDIEGSLGELV